jgi:hypothetical protein
MVMVLTVSLSFFKAADSIDLTFFITPDLAGAKLIKFGIESKHSCAETSTPKFQQNVVESLREMRVVVEENAAVPAAKL